MTDRQATRLIATLFILVVGLIAWRHVRDRGGAPPPGRFTYPTALYSIFAVVADIGAPGFAAVFATAVTMGIAFRVVDLDKLPGPSPTTSVGRRRITVKLPAGAVPTGATAGGQA